MWVTIGKRAWPMSQSEYDKFLNEIASEQVPFGIYAVEKQGKAEMRLDYCTSITQLKSMTREYKKNGFKVYANGR